LHDIQEFELLCAGDTVGINVLFGSHNCNANEKEIAPMVCLAVMPTALIPFHLRYQCYNQTAPNGPTNSHHLFTGMEGESPSGEGTWAFHPCHQTAAEEDVSVKL